MTHMSIASQFAAGYSSSPDLGTPDAKPLGWVDAQLSAELLAQAITVAAPRLLVHNFSIGRLKLLFDIHVTNAGPTIPIALDTHRSGPQGQFL